MIIVYFYVELFLHQVDLTVTEFIYQYMYM